MLAELSCYKSQMVPIYVICKSSCVLPHVCLKYL
jgi:hypothetical protein